MVGKPVRPMARSICESLFGHASDGVLVVSADGQVLRANPRAGELLGWTEAELLDLDPDVVVDPRDVRWRAALDTREREGVFRGVLRLRRRDGSTFSAHVTTAAVRDDESAGAYISFRDTTPTETVGVRTVKTPRAAADVIDSLESFSDMYVGVDADWKVTHLNAQTEYRLRVSRDDVIGGDLWEKFPALVGTRFEQVYRSVMRTGEQASLEDYYAAADLWCEVRAYPLFRGGMGLYFRDIGERREQEQERERLLAAERRARAAAEEAQRALAYRACHDELTGLLNRSGLVQEVESVLAARPASGVTVMFIDLDRFKLVNDSLGHVAGDQLLTVFARRLADVARPGDLVARFGGDEFVMVLFDASAEEAGRLAEEVVAASRQPVDEDARLRVTASIGLASATGTANLETLLREADAALYRAKDAGREWAAWFDEQMHLESVNRVQTELDLRLALDRDELFLDYQPAFDLRFERITHVEALVRWRHPVRGLVSPGEFIPVAEECGLIHRLGEWVLARAVEQAVRWAHLPGLRVWINVSPAQLADRGWPELLAAHLERVGLPADRLGIEVTESAVADRSRLTDVLERVRALGVQIAIDDFGTGYSSLARLNEFPVDVIKIDRSFVVDLGTPRGEALLAGIVTLSHAIDAHVIAEGVETVSQLAALSALGADSASGYLLARPAAPEHLPLVIPTELDFSWRAGLHPTLEKAFSSVAGTRPLTCAPVGEDGPVPIVPLPA
jgi:diguanylate cyclase (GGDEF)-like protein/PAS domain S-box-containing protein